MPSAVNQQTSGKKCNWCRKRFTPAEQADPNTVRFCTHAKIIMKFHPDCHILHRKATH